MGKSFAKFDDSDFQDFIKEFRKNIKDAAIDEGLLDVLDDMGNKVLNGAKRKTPVDTGTLRRGWSKDPAKKNGKIFSVEVSNNVEYAQFLEEGHRKRGGGFKPGEHMLQQSVDAIEKDFHKKVAKGFEEKMKRILGG